MVNEAMVEVINALPGSNLKKLYNLFGFII